MNLWKIANNYLSGTWHAHKNKHNSKDKPCKDFQLSMAMLKKCTKIHKGTFLEIALKDTLLVDLRLKNEFE